MTVEQYFVVVQSVLMVVGVVGKRRAFHSLDWQSFAFSIAHVGLRTKPKKRLKIGYSSVR